MESTNSNIEKQKKIKLNFDKSYIKLVQNRPFNKIYGYMDPWHELVHKQNKKLSLPCSEICGNVYNAFLQ